MSGFDEIVDFLVVGSGAGSIPAGLLAKEQGKSVLILEKAEFVGGITAKSGGVMWIPNNHFMHEDGEDESHEKAIEYLDNVTAGKNDQPGTTPEKREAYVTWAPKMLKYLCDKGIKFYRQTYWPDYYDNLPGGCKTSRCVTAELFDLNELGDWKAKFRKGFMPAPARLDEAFVLATFAKSWAGKKMLAKIILRTIKCKLTGKDPMAAGSALQGRLLQAALKENLDIRLESPVTDLIIENGKAVGAVTVKDGKPWKVGANLGILVNAGGFAKNQAMRDKYQPGTRAEWSNAIESDTGDLIQIMESHGAALGQMEEMVGYQTTLAPGWEEAYVKPGAQSTLAHPHAILVDQSGMRYQNEGGSYHEFCVNMLKRNETVPAVPSWGVFDTTHMKYYMLAGTMPGLKKPKEWRETGYLKEGNTIEELAVAMNVDSAALKGTVERFNGFVEKGHDDDFNRGDREYDKWLGDPNNEPNEALGKIETGPFYAIPVVPGDVSTYGGVLTDENARVLTTDGGVIEGLYATGVSTASVMGRAYVGAGSSIGPSMTFGFIAARHALGLSGA